ncbi:MAG: NHL repeat-containing protein [Treponema sp.]|nr:NHL repeat-containing protein [Treponema sp.]
MKKGESTVTSSSARIKRISMMTAAVLVSAAAFLYAQNDTAGLTAKNRIRTAGEGIASREFRRGVQAYYRGSFNEAVLQLEKSLLYKSDDNLILDWLGKAYYRSGMEGEALTAWQKAYDSGYGGLLMQNRIEIVQERRITGSSYENSMRYTEAGSFPGVRGNTLIFSEPVSVLPDRDGSVWVAAYGTNELLKINVNGTVVSRAEGPVNGFDRPLDVIRLQNGNLLVSESAGDRLSLLKPNGSFIKYIGGKGRGTGQCVGPQYLAEDANGNIYVTDYGNGRVDVFDRDGKGLFSFGKKQDGFDGFKGPTGIAVIGDSVYVADCVSGAVYQFDLAGNYERLLVQEKTFVHPESMKVWGRYLVVCDSNKVISVDSDTGATYECARSGNAPSRLTSAVPDINGNVLVTDMRSNEVYVMAKLQELIGGLFVQIERVNADSFPAVTIELSVENRHRQPVVGLRAENFYLTEDKRPVAEQKLLGAASNNTVEDITLIIDRSSGSAAYAEQAESVVRELASDMNGEGTLRIIAAGAVPAAEYTGSPRAAELFSIKAVKTGISDTVPVDLAVRLAANDLINAEKKRAIIFITTGKVTQNAFARYGLAELTAYLNNNSIALSVIQLTQNSCDEEINYLCSNTEGQQYYVFRPEGLSDVIRDLKNLPSGVYQLSYVSSLQTNMGEAYLPVESEVYLMNRSGRDETGYFAPLQ